MSWLVIAAVVGVLAGGVVLLRRRRHRVRAEHLWRVEGGRILEEATTTTALLAAAAQRRTALAQVSTAVTRVGSHLDRLAELAPTSEDGAAARAAAAGIRRVLSDVESEALVGASGGAADRRGADPELVADLDRLGRHIGAVARPER